MLLCEMLQDHVYFCGLDWNNLLRRKAEFIPQLDNDEDTSYFDSEYYEPVGNKHFRKA